MSPYQSIKPVIVELLGLSRDAIHMHIGFASLIAVLLITKRSATSFRVLIPGFVLSLLMEIMDMRDDYNLGRNPNVVATLHDLINTNFIPLAICLMARMKRFRIT